MQRWRVAFCIRARCPGCVVGAGLDSDGGVGVLLRELLTGREVSGSRWSSEVGGVHRPAWERPFLASRKRCMLTQLEQLLQHVFLTPITCVGLPLCAGVWQALKRMPPHTAETQSTTHQCHTRSRSHRSQEGRWATICGSLHVLRPGKHTGVVGCETLVCSRI